MFDEQQRGPGDNPTVGIILCAAKDASIVRYSVLHGNEKLFATRYQLVLPTEEELRRELIREQRLLEERGARKGRGKKIARPGGECHSTCNWCAFRALGFIELTEP